MKIALKSHLFCRLAVFICLLAFSLPALAQNRALVYLTDFGLKDGAVAAMKGVAFSVSPNIPQFDLTHEIPAYDIWQASCRLAQTVPYWPAGTVFVAVVDPGVGSSRKSVVAKTKSSHFIVAPDNGTLTLLEDSIGLEAVRLIDETRNRLPGSSESYTFHGRDLYSFTAARLAAGIIRFEELGPRLDSGWCRIPYQKARFEGSDFIGTIPVLDIQYGNIWTNIPLSLLREKGIQYGDLLQVFIYKEERQVYSGTLPFATTFSAVAEGKPVAYINSMLQFSIGINRGSFADTFQISSGADWKIILRKLP